MKKLLTLLSCASLTAVSCLSVTSCSNNTEYEDIFEPDESKNDGEFIKPGTEEVIESVQKAISDTVIADVSVKKTGGELLISDSLSSEQIINQLIESIYKKVSITEEAFKISIDSNNSFSLPELKGVSSDGISFSEDANVTEGQAFLRLTYFDKEIFSKSFSWTVPEYNIIENVINMLHSNSYSIVGDYKSKKVDLPLVDLNDMGFPMKITMGSIYIFISFLNITADNNTFSSNYDVADSINKIKGVLKKLVSLDVKKLASANPDEIDGKAIYSEFDKNYRQIFRELFEVVSEVMVDFGISDTIIFPATEKRPEIEVKIKDILDVNILDIFEIDPSSLNMEDSVGMGIKMKMNVQLGSKGKENNIALIDMLANIAPNVVHLFSKFLNPDTYTESHNLLFMILKELLTDMDPDLLSINEKNNKDHFSASNAKNGMDSLLFNLMLDYNKNNRKTENLNLWIHLKLDLLDIPIEGNKKVFDDNLYEVMEDIRIVPGEMALKLINRLFNFEGKQYLDLDQNILAPNLNIKFLNETDINLEAIVERMDLSTVGKEAVKAAIPLIKGNITDKLNSTLNSMLPELSLQKIMNNYATKLLTEIGVDKKYLEESNISIKKAQFVFQFYHKEQKEWHSVNKGLSSRTFEIYSSIKLKIVNAQFSVDVNTEHNNFHYLTKQDLTFDIIFSDNDTK
ncbi:hypothetical protein [Spiroplasma endosymbiont of Diplazon laetatorius]|uniref:hypothetical protein n=1 Tax=Spiroplasma endosymbiont of Diplazon laetatorius TaxID=3066322 RepID=UPI0030D166D6